jgi:hypothetical protein
MNDCCASRQTSPRGWDGGDQEKSSALGVALNHDSWLRCTLRRRPSAIGPGSAARGRRPKIRRCRVGPDRPIVHGSGPGRGPVEVLRRPSSARCASVAVGWAGESRVVGTGRYRELSEMQPTGLRPTHPAAAPEFHPAATGPVAGTFRADVGVGAQLLILCLGVLFRKHRTRQRTSPQRIKSTTMPTTTVTGIEICRLARYHALAVSSAEPDLQLPLVQVPP